MDFTFDLATNQLVPTNGVDEIALKWRSREPVRIHFHRDGTDELLPSGFGLALYLERAGTLLATCTSFTAPAAATGYYTGSLILNTTPLTTAFATATVLAIAASVEAHWWATGEASSPAISDNVVGAQIIRPSVTPEPASVEIIAGASEYLEQNVAVWKPSITALTGGTATCLDYITTDGKTDLFVILKISSEIQDWILTTGTTAEDAENGVVRPDDYDASTNAQVWKRLR